MNLLESLDAGAQIARAAMENPDLGSIDEILETTERYAAWVQDNDGEAAADAFRDGAYSVLESDENG